MIGLILSLMIHPPLLLVVEQPTVGYGPDGQRISIPAGAEIDVCIDELGVLLDYDFDLMVVRVPAPCNERPIFSDGFE